MGKWTRYEPLLLGIPGELVVPSGDYWESERRITKSTCVAHYTVEINGWRVFCWNTICLKAAPASTIKASPGDTIEWRTEFVHKAPGNVTWMPENDPIARLACIYDACSQPLTSRGNPDVFV